MTMTAKSLIKTLFKASISVGALWLVFQQVDAFELLTTISHIEVFPLLAAFFLLLMAQMMSGLRLYRYLRAENVKITEPAATRLYFVGMLFNLALPGGIGGDGYIAWKLNKQKKIKLSRAIQRMISARANGLVALISITLALALFSPLIQLVSGYVYWILCYISGCFIVYSYAATRFLSEPPRLQRTALLYSLTIQFTYALMAYYLLVGFGVEDITIYVDYLILFMVACIISVIPISIGGVGLRELTFLLAAPFFGLSVEIGIALSVSFFVLTVAVSVLGIPAYFLLQKK